MPPKSEVFAFELAEIFTTLDIGKTTSEVIFTTSKLVLTTFDLVFAVFGA